MAWTISRRLTEPLCQYDLRKARRLALGNQQLTELAVPFGVEGLRQLAEADRWGFLSRARRRYSPKLGEFVAE